MACRRDPHNDAVVFVLRGKVRFLELADTLDRSLDLGFAQCVVWNLADGDLGALSLHELEWVVARVLAGPWAPRKWAILATPGPSLAAAAMIVAAAEEKGFGDRAEAFVDRSAAFEWLASRERRTTPASPDAELLRR